MNNQGEAKLFSERNSMDTRINWEAPVREDMAKFTEEYMQSRDIARNCIEGQASKDKVILVRGVNPHKTRRLEGGSWKYLGIYPEVKVLICEDCMNKIKAVWGEGPLAQGGVPSITVTRLPKGGSMSRGETQTRLR